MIIKRAFYREATQTSLAVVLVLVVLFLILSLTKLLGRAAGGEHAADIVFQLLALELLSSLDVLLLLALYVGILLTLGRWYRDSEMTVLAACGVGLGSISRLVIQLALCFSVVIGALALLLSPWANTVAEQVKSESERETEISTAPPGVFMELRKGRGIFYMEKIGAGKIFENVFIHDRESARQNIVVARTGRQFTDSNTGEKFLVLKNGALYEGITGEPDYQVVEFDTYNARLEEKDAEQPETPLDGVSSLHLLRSQTRRHIAEWHWRISKPISVFVLAAFALLLAHTDPRRGRVGNLLAAILIYFIYTNVLGVGETLLKDGRAPQALGLWWVHGSLGALASYLLVRRANNKPLLPFLRNATR